MCMCEVPICSMVTSINRRGTVPATPWNILVEQAATLAGSEIEEPTGADDLWQRFRDPPCWDLRQLNTAETAWSFSNDLSWDVLHCYMLCHPMLISFQWWENWISFHTRPVCCVQTELSQRRCSWLELCQCCAVLLGKPRKRHEAVLMEMN